MPLLIAFVAIPVSYLGVLVMSLFADIHETTVTMVPLFGIGIAIDYALIMVTRWREQWAGGSGSRHGGAPGHGHGGEGDRVLQPGGRMWTSFARKVVRHRRIAAAGATAVLGTLAVVALGININVPVTANLDHDGPGHDGLVALTSVGIPSGRLYAFDVHVPSGTNADSVVSVIAALPGVHTVAAPTGEAWRRDGSAVVTVLPVDDGGIEAGRRTIEQVISAVPDGVGVGGYTAQQIDFADVTHGAFGWMPAILSIVSYLMPARAFRSLLLPLKAVLMNLLSLGAVIGSMVVLWQWGWGTEALLGIQSDGVVGTSLPVTIFAFLYGLSVDYEVFILARMREEYDRTGITVKPGESPAMSSGKQKIARPVAIPAWLFLLCAARDSNPEPAD